MLKTTAGTVVFWLVIAAVIVLSILGLFVYKRDSLMTLLQVIFAIAIVIILFVIAFSIYNMEMVNAIRNSGKIRKVTPIFVGMKDLADSKDEMFETLDKNASTYLDLGNSIGQQGGAEYCYNFWLYIDRSTIGTVFPQPDDVNKVKQFNTDSGLEDLPQTSSNAIQPGLEQVILFLKGSKQLYRYKGLCFTDNDPENTYKTDLMVKSPLVKLERGLDVLTIEFNTIESPDAVKERAGNTCQDLSTNWEAMNAYKVSLKNLTAKYDKQWIMVTVVLADTYPSDPLPIRNKIRCSVYVNATLELDKYIDSKLDSINVMGSTLKTNSGNLYINPKVTAPSNVWVKNEAGSYKDKGSFVVTPDFSDKKRAIVMSDLTYFNYAPDANEIRTLFNNGYTKKWAPTLSAQLAGAADDPLLNGIPSQPDKSVLRQLNRY